MSVEGELRIALFYRDRHVSRVGISSSRPLQLPTLFEGKQVEEALHTLPQLYSLCATAQASAAATACRQALGLRTDRQVIQAESMLVWIETAREHLLRILMDWPLFIDEAPERDQLLLVSRLLPAAKSACFGGGGSFSLRPVLRLDQASLAEVLQLFLDTSQQVIYGMPPSAWYGMQNLDDLHQWLERGDTLSARLMQKLRDDQLAHLGDSEINALPEVEPQVMNQRLLQMGADRFVAAPDWAGLPCETSPLTRQIAHPLIQALRPSYGAGLLTRWVARLLELASIPVRLQKIVHALMDGSVAGLNEPIDSNGESGLGVVEAARGRLIHRVSQRDGIIHRYQIVAPTEWNFHPEGVVAQGLLGLVAENEHQLKRYAGLFINAVDPCVGYRLEIV